MNSITQTTQGATQIISSIATFFKTYNVKGIARRCHAEKEKGFSFFSVFSYLLSTIFTHKSMYMNRLTDSYIPEFSKNTSYRLLNSTKVHWQKFTALLSAQIIKTTLRPLTSDSRKEVFILDDSAFERPNAKKVELAAKLYDHAAHCYTKGFRFLQLGWSDGNTFLPVTSALLSSANQKNVIQPVKGPLDKRNLSSQRKLQAQRKGTDVALDLLRSAIGWGHQANYILMDSWFSSPKMIHQIKQLDVDTIAMVKKTSKVYYRYNGQLMSAPDIYKANKKRPGRSRYLLSVDVLIPAGEHGATDLPVRLVFVRNRSKRKEYLVLISTDTSLSEDEVIQLYGKRWSIEVYFKITKSYLKLASSFRGLSYDAACAHVAIVATQYMLLAIQNREQVDDRSLGELFYLMCNELEDVSYLEALEQLISLFTRLARDYDLLTDDQLNNMIDDFMEQLPSPFKKALKRVA